MYSGSMYAWPVIYLMDACQSAGRTVESLPVEQHVHAESIRVACVPFTHRTSETITQTDVRPAYRLTNLFSRTRVAYISKAACSVFVRIVDAGGSTKQANPDENR